MDEPPICPGATRARAASARSRSGGQFVEVLTTYGKVQTLVSSTFVRCIEKVVARTEARGPAAIPALAGRRLDARLRGPARASARPVIGPPARPASGRRGAGLPSAVRLSVDRGRLAVLRRRRSRRRASGRPRAPDHRAHSAHGRSRCAASELDRPDAGRVRSTSYALWNGDLLHRWRAPGRRRGGAWTSTTA